MISTRAAVIREGGHVQMIESKNIVPGDILYLKAGDKVPADSILFWSMQLRIDGSQLTGETDPVLRIPQLNGVLFGFVYSYSFYSGSSWY